jgi:cob(I)alamin adenosyltransferase
MPKITKVYTKGGDDGSTSLGGGQRVAKDSSRVTAYGEVDELNCFIGQALATGLTPENEQALRTVQNELFNLGSDLCFLEDDKAKLRLPRIDKRHVRALEDILDRMTEQLGPLENFILPGGSPSAALLHVARAVCRRAERAVVSLAAGEAVGEWTLRYLNRLSDVLFVMARYENKQRGRSEVTWDSRA